MKKRKILFAFFAALVLLLLGTLTAFAINSGFTTEEMSEEDVRWVINDIKINTINEEPERKVFDSFAVSDTGKIAVVHHPLMGGGKDEICVYGSDGRFQYGFSLQYTGGVNVEWDGNNLLIYLARSDVAIAVNRDGSILEVASILASKENDRHWQDVDRRVKEVNGSTYSATNAILPFWRYSKLIQETESGEKTVIYEVPNLQGVNIAATLILLGFFTLCFVLCLLRFPRFRNFFSKKKRVEKEE